MLFKIITLSEIIEENNYFIIKILEYNIKHTQTHTHTHTHTQHTRTNITYDNIMQPVVQYTLDILIRTRVVSLLLYINSIQY